jgi:glycosyltransferase involved in cell wall biosynthesis
LDPSSGWILPALVKGLRIIKDKRINIIIATYPSESAMVIGTLLSLITGKKLILDYRDPWTTHGRTYCKVFGKSINDFFEKLSLRRASALVFCSEIMRDGLLSALGKYTRASSHVIPNGFHSQDNIQPLCLGKTRKNMVYAGNLAGERRIELLAKPLSQLLKEGTITTDNFCFHVFGELKTADKEVIREYGLQNMIKE